MRTDTLVHLSTAKAGQIFGYMMIWNAPVYGSLFGVPAKFAMDGRGRYTCPNGTPICENHDEDQRVGWVAKSWVDPVGLGFIGYLYPDFFSLENAIALAVGKYYISPGGGYERMKLDRGRGILQITGGQLNEITITQTPGTTRLKCRDDQANERIDFAIEALARAIDYLEMSA